MNGTFLESIKMFTRINKYKCFKKQFLSKIYLNEKDIFLFISKKLSTTLNKIDINKFENLQS